MNEWEAELEISPVKLTPHASNDVSNVKGVPVNDAPSQWGVPDISKGVPKNLYDFSSRVGDEVGGLNVGGLNNGQDASLVNPKPLDRVALEKEIRVAMAKLGITPEVLIKRHKELLDYENPTINLKALELLYKMMGLLKEQVEHSGSVDVSIALKAARDRVVRYGD